MKHALRVILLAASGVLGWAVVLSGGGAGIAAPPPLSLDGYRDEKLPEGPHDSASLHGINENCYVCHGNYRTESLVQSHAKETIGCVRCHGQSLPHQVDEFHRTPPDKMYGRQDVDKMCHKCHDVHDAPAVKVLQRWRQRCSPKTDPKEIACTDCHYDHRLPSRNVVWDRQTRKVVVRKQGQSISAKQQK